MAIKDNTLKLVGSKNAYLDLGALETFDLAPDRWTLEAWVNFTNPEATGWVFGVLRNIHPPLNSLWLTWEGGKFNLHSGNPTSGHVWSQQTEMTFHFGYWYHLMLDVSPPENINGKNLRSIGYTGTQKGKVEQVGPTKWVEYREGSDGVVATYTESHRDDWSVYLKDKDNQAVQFDMHRKKGRLNRKDIFDINESSAHDLQARLYCNGQPVLENGRCQSLHTLGRIMVGGTDQGASEWEIIPNGHNVKKVDYAGGGSFVNVADKRWVEYKANSAQIFATFKESGRDEASITLKKEDGADIKLDLGTRKVWVNNTALFGISEISVNSGYFVNGYNANYVEYETSGAKGAFYQLTKGEWVHFTQDQDPRDVIVPEFQEEGRDEWSVYLLRGGERFQMDLHRKMVLVNGVEQYTITAFRENVLPEKEIPSVNGALIRDLKIWGTSVPEGDLWDPFKAPERDETHLKGLYPLINGSISNLKSEDPSAPPLPQGKGLFWVIAPDYPLAAMRHNVTACDFSGNAEEHIIIKPGDSFGLEKAITLESWLKLNAASADAGPVLSHRRDDGAGWELKFSQNEIAFTLFLGEENTTLQSFKHSGNLPVGVWHHIAVSFDGTHMTLLVNGIQKFKRTVEKAPVYTTQAPLYMGSNQKFPGRTAFNGRVAEVRIWNVALDEWAIQQLMFRSFSTLPENLVDSRRRNVQSTNLVGYWKLDATYNEAVNDQSDKRNHGEAKKVIRSLDHLPVLGRRSFNVEEHRLNWRKFWEITSVTDQSTLQTLNNEINGLKETLSETEKKKEALEKEKKDLNTLITELKSKLVETEASGSTLSTIIEKANQEIANARKNLIETGSDYKLGTVNLELMVIPAGEGNKFILPQYSHNIPTGDQLSKLELEFSPKDTASRPPEDIAVPDVTGLTEVMAYRILSNASLKADLKYQAVPVNDRNVDRVVRQIPEAGERKKINTAVIIFIGKPA